MLEKQKPKLEINKKTYELFLSIGAIDELQEKFDTSFTEIITKITKNSKELLNDSLLILQSIINSLEDEKLSIDDMYKIFPKASKENEEKILEIHTEIIKLITLVMSNCLPEKEEEDYYDEEEEDDVEKINIVRLINLGKIMGFSEKEIATMSLRKFHIIWNDYMEYNGLKEPEQKSIDDVIGRWVKWRTKHLDLK